MRFSSVLVGLFAAVAAAQTSLGPNAFNTPKTGNWLLTAGKPTTFTWSNKEGSKVTIRLRTGANGDLDKGTVVAQSIDNTGSYTFTPDKDIEEGASYTLEIVDDDDPTKVNYTSQFVIQSDNKAVPSSASASATASSSASSKSSASASASSSSSASASSKSKSAASSSASASASASKSSASASSASVTSDAASTSSTAAPAPSDNAAAPVMKAGGSLLAVAAAFAYAL